MVLGTFRGEEDVEFVRDAVSVNVVDGLEDCESSRGRGGQLRFELAREAEAKYLQSGPCVRSFSSC